MISVESLNLVNGMINNSTTAKLRKKQSELEVQAMIAKMEAEDAALLTMLDELESNAQSEVEILLDTTEHESKPHGVEIAHITKELPNNPVTLTIEELASYIIRGCSIKPSLMRSTKKDSFISSSIVALDIDNYEGSVVTVENFLSLSEQVRLRPFLIYESFSSTKECPRYRVLYRFNRTITDVVEIEKLYNYVWQQFPHVPLDLSVGYHSILFGGKSIVLLNNSVNIMPDLSNVSFIKRKTGVTAPVKNKTDASIKHITKEEIRANLEALRPQYEGRIMNARDINQNIKLTDLLNVSLEQRFRCILSNHEDKNPSARISTDKNSGEQFYICSCDAMGYRVISLYKELFNLSSTTAAIVEISNLLGINSEYQRRAREFIDTLYSNFDYVAQDIAGKLSKASTSMYLLFLRIARERAIKPVSINENDIAIYVSNSYIQDKMMQEGISGSGDVNRKIAELCRVGLIRKLTSKEIDPTSLAESKALTMHNTVDYYCILDLTDERIKFINDKLTHGKRVGYRQYGTNAQRRINTHGYEYIRNNVHTQAYAKKEDKEVFLALTAIVESGAKCFNEDDINRAIRKRNHRINKKQAEKLILNFLNKLVDVFGLERTRVNKTNRELHGIDKKYKSNTVVYIVPDNNEEDILYLEKMLSEV